MLKNLLQLKPVPISQDGALLALRVAGVLPLLLKHGMEKVFTFSAMASHFPNPLHIGTLPSLIFAMLSDSICTVLIIVGFATRWAALIAFVNILVAGPWCITSSSSDVEQIMESLSSFIWPSFSPCFWLVPGNTA